MNIHMSLYTINVRVLQCVAFCCRVLQCVAVCCYVYSHVSLHNKCKGVAVCCILLHFVAECCSVLQCVVMYIHMSLYTINVE